MKSKITLAVSIVPVLVLAAVAAAVSPTTFIRRNDVNESIKLENMAGTDATGSARVNGHVRDNLYSTVILIDLNNAPPQQSRVFEAWLVDNDTGYKLSLGTFDFGNSRNDTLIFTQKMVNLPIYDLIVITSEPRFDTNPFPGKAILQGTIPSSLTNIATLKASLKGGNENPTTNSPASGTGTFIINTADNTLKFDISYSGLSATETGAHIHGPVSATENAPVLFPLPAGERKTGTWNYPENLEKDILAGRTYVNVHSTNFPNGEIRGQITR